MAMWSGFEFAGRLTRALPVLMLAHSLHAHAQPSRPEYLVGDAIAVDADARRLTVKVDSGESVLVLVGEDAVLLRAQPGATSLAQATRLLLPEIAVGDRVMVRGARSADQSLQARQVVVMTRGDVDRKQDAEQADWRRRGVVGVVTAIDAARGQLILRIGRAADAPTLTLSTTTRPVAFRRYAPDSVKFSDARPSAFGELQVGDELRALGERDPDSGVFLAEQVVFGSFRVVSGTISALDPARSAVVVRDEESQQDVTVAVGPDARVRRLPPEIADRLAQRDRSGGLGRGEGGSRNGAAGSRPEDLLERLPSTTLADLKLGDRILISSTKGDDPSRANAIAMLVGIEALLPTAASRAGRALDAGLPPELLDLGLSIP